MFENKRWSVSREDIARTLTFEREARQTRAPSDQYRPTSTVAQPNLAGGRSAGGEHTVFKWTGSTTRLVREGQDGREVNVEAVKNQLAEQLLTDQRSVALSLAPTRRTSPARTGTNSGLRTSSGRVVPASLEVWPRSSTTFAWPRRGSTGSWSHRGALLVQPRGRANHHRRRLPERVGITMGSNGARTIPSVAGGIARWPPPSSTPCSTRATSLKKRHWHLYWISSYGQPPLGMQGLDATVDEDSGLDFQFVNSTSDYLLVQARVEGSTLIFGLYETKPDWTVKVDGPVITNVVPANRETVQQPEPTMPVGRSLQVEGAQDGFDAAITRTVTAGTDVRQLRLRSHYIPSRNVVLNGTGGA